MEAGLIIGILSFVFGLILGSFFNVCIFRIPLKKSIVYPPSSCPKCGENIKLYDNIPLISYLILLGKCRACRNPIPIIYPFIEVITGMISVALFIKYGGMGPQFFLSLIFCGALVVISIIDLKHQIIPDIISLPGIIVGLGVSFLKIFPLSWSDSLFGIIGGGGVLFLIAVVFERLTGKEGMGGGDVKLLAMIGAWLGWRALPFVILISSLTGTLIGGSSLLFSGRGYRSKIPFGPFLSMGALIYLFFGAEIASWYIRMIS